MNSTSVTVDTLSAFESSENKEIKVIFKYYDLSEQIRVNLLFRKYTSSVETISTEDIERTYKKI